MKIAFGIIVLNGNYVLKEVLKTIYPYASQILIAEGPVTYWQDRGYTTSIDGTNEVIDNFPDAENKIKIVHSQYTEKKSQCNAYMSMMNDNIDYMWQIDADEVYKPEDIEKMIALLEKEQYTSVGFQSTSFYGGFERYITGYEQKFEFMRIFKVYPGSMWEKHRPPTMKHRKGYKTLPKHLSFKITAEKYGIYIYHYSYVFPFQVFEKIKYYKAAVSKNVSIDNYLEKVYFPWINGDNQSRFYIEQQYQGVHEFKPKVRGDAYTEHFKGEHPKIIQDNIGKYIDKFTKQLKMLNDER